MKRKKNLEKTNIGKKKTFLAIIPARGNSQRIRNKNLIKLNKKPLIYWTIVSAIRSKYISKVCVTSDSKKILDYSKKFNVTTILRPKNLSGNIIMPDHAIKHAYLKLKKEYDYIVMLQPTSPLRTYRDIDNSIDIILKNKSNSLFSSSIESRFIWKKNKITYQPINYDLKNRPRHQDVSFYFENGSIYISESKLFIQKTNRLGGKISTYVMPFEKSIDIDNIEDLKEAEKIMKSYKKNLHK